MADGVTSPIVAPRQGPPRAFVAWGLAFARKPILDVIGRTPIAIVDSFSSEGTDDATGLPIWSPERLRNLDPQVLDVIILSDPERFGAEIRACIAGFGDFDVSTWLDHVSHTPNSDEALKALCVPDGEPAQAFEDDAIVLVTGRLCQGGAEKQLVLIARALCDLGRRVTLVRLAADGPGAEHLHALLGSREVTHRILMAREQEASLSVAPGQVELWRSLCQLLDPVGALLAARLVDTLRANRPERVISFLDGPNLISGIAAVVAKVPKVILSGRNVAPVEFPVLPHVFAPMGSARDLYRAFVARPSVRLCNNSKAGATSYARWLEMDVAGIEVIPNVVDAAPERGSFVTLREEFSVPPGEKVIVAVMRLMPEKDPLALVPVFEGLAKSGVHFRGFVVGGGLLSEQLRQAIHAAGLSDRVALLGERRRGAECMIGADLLVHTAIAEGTPNVLLEAMRAGTPFVATDVGGSREVVPPQFHSWLVPHGSWDLLVERCVVALEASLASKAELMRSVAGRAELRVAETFASV